MIFLYDSKTAENGPAKFMGVTGLSFSWWGMDIVFTGVNSMIMMNSETVVGTFSETTNGWD